MPPLFSDISVISNQGIVDRYV